MKESYRGAILTEVMNIADLVLKARKAMSSSDWFALKSIVKLWKQEIDEFEGKCSVV